MKKTTKMYLHGDRDSAFEKGEMLGLEGEALSMFSHALTEVEFDVEVDMGTGEAKIIKVDGRELVKEQ